MNYIPSDVILNILQYGGDLPLNPKILVNQIHDIYPKYSFKRGYKLSKLQEATKTEEAYKLYKFLTECDVVNVTRCDGIGIERSLAICNSLTGTIPNINYIISKIVCMGYKVTYNVGKVYYLKIDDNDELSRIYSIFNPILPHFDPRKNCVISGKIKTRLGDIMSMVDDDPYKWYLKHTDICLPQIYRHCISERNYEKCIVDTYHNETIAKRLYDIVISYQHDIMVLYFGSRKKLNLICSSKEKLHLLLHEFNVTQEAHLLVIHLDEHETYGFMELMRLKNMYLSY
ncbi:hypothetical protein D3C87_1203940 [compost metagenome]